MGSGNLMSTWQRYNFIYTSSGAEPDASSGKLSTKAHTLYVDPAFRCGGGNGGVYHENGKCNEQ